MENNLVVIPIETLRSEISDCVKKEVQSFLSSIQPEKSKDELLTRKEAAKLLGISLPTLHSWTLAGRVQGYRIASRVRYKRSDLESSPQRIKSTTPAA